MSEKAERALVNLYQERRGVLGDYAWENEWDRWEEFLVCLLIGAGAGPGAARTAIGILGDLGLAKPAILAKSESLPMVDGVLDRSGVQTVGEVNPSVLLTKVAKRALDDWNGYIQRFLRQHALNMSSDLVDKLTKDGLSTNQAERAAILWLQNVANLPLVASSNKLVQTFLAKSEMTQDELLDVADENGLNMAVLDDLLAAEPPPAPNK